MEVIVFIGIQGSGKSTFYRERFFHSHVRLNLDMLRTRHRERVLFRACLRARQPVVIDNTNPTRHDRQRYIGPAREADFRVMAYYFPADLERCKRWNAQRPPERVIPLAGVMDAYKRMEPPTLDEGLAGLFEVTVDAEDRFVVRSMGA